MPPTCCEVDQVEVTKVDFMKDIHEIPLYKRIFGKIIPKTTPVIHVDTAFADAAYHGEDAVFCNDILHIVADGVGGTKISSAPFAKSIVHNVQRELVGTLGSSKSKRIRRKDFIDKIIKGAETTRISYHGQAKMACAFSVTYIDCYKSRLLCLAMGDTKTIVVRGANVIFESAAIVHEFNVPVTLSTSKCIEPRKCVLDFKFPILPGDVCITCSDGITDNLFKDDIVRVVRQNCQNGGSQIAEKLIVLAKERCLNPINGKSPFAVSAAIEYKKRGLHEINDIRSRKDFEDKVDKWMSKISTQSVLDRQVVLDLSVKYYNMSSLESFANRSKGKIDDMTVAVSIIS